MTCALTHCHISVIRHVWVVEFAMPPMQAKLIHVLISYIQQVSLQTCSLTEQLNLVVLKYLTVAITLWWCWSSWQTWCLLKQVNRVVLKDLTRNSNYDIVVVPFNSQGSGPPSPPVAVYVGEAVPTGEPQAVEGQPVSSTEVRLHWKPPQQSQQNGDLLGYKVWQKKMPLSVQL